MYTFFICFVLFCFVFLLTCKQKKLLTLGVRTNNLSTVVFVGLVLFGMIFHCCVLVFSFISWSTHPIH